MAAFITPVVTVRTTTFAPDVSRLSGSPRSKPFGYVCAKPRPTTPIAAAWPLQRFLSNFIFYTPLGKSLRAMTSSGVKSKSVNTTGEPTVFEASAGVPPSKKTILVTGASGATGGRVITQLLSEENRTRYRVLALTRSREKCYEMLRAAGVQNVRELESKGILNLIISDMANLPRDSVFDVDCVISCTGTKAGPRDDDEKRSKYYQGIIKYPAEVLEDTPENVEFKSVSKVVDTLREEVESSSTHITPAPEVSIFDFRPYIANPPGIEWGSLDDVVMGGVSESTISVNADKNNVLEFTGTVRTENNGGFVSTRSADFDTNLDLSKFDGVQLRVYGDGNRYKFIFRCDRKWDSYAHCVSFDTTPGQWQLVNIPFSSFKTVMRGKVVQDGPKFTPESICAIQLMLSKFEYDGALNPSFKAGKFELLVASIRPYYDDTSVKQVQSQEAGKKNVQWIHLSSAAVTRPLRLDEIKGTPSDVPILQLNATIGNLLNWKLAGEDAVRTSNLNYVIVRSCALTLEEKKGIENLKFEQGDLLNGRVSRDDMAHFLVKLIDVADTAVGKTFEVATVDPAAEKLDDIDQRLNVLKSDADTGRTFGPFPYVPTKESLAA